MDKNQKEKKNELSKLMLAGAMPNANHTNMPAVVKGFIVMNMRFLTYWSCRPGPEKAPGIDVDLAAK